MDWTQVVIATTHEGIEPVCGRLYHLGVTGTEIEDRQDFEEFLEQNTPYWDYVDEALSRRMQGETRVKAYVAQNASGAELLQLIRGSMAELHAADDEGRFGRLEVTLVSLSEDDWANNWKQYYKPTHVGRRIVVVPAWEDYAVQPGEIPLRMNPGMAFGTGTHETTRLCIGLLEEFLPDGAQMLDIGTGSGILAIAGLLLGAKSALGVDIDEVAVKVARENARLNGVDGRYDAVCGDLVKEVRGHFGLITANIVADVIIRLAPAVPAYLAPGGVFIASGIIGERAPEVRRALGDAGLAVVREAEEHGWRAFACRAAENAGR